MKFQDSSFNGLKVTVGTKSVTHPCTHAPKAICPINFFKVGSIMKECDVSGINLFIRSVSLLKMLGSQKGCTKYMKFYSTF